MRKYALQFLFFLILCFLFEASGTEGAPATFVDEVGREVTFSFPPERIISLAPNVTEILFSLGLDKEIVGVSTHSNFPKEAGGKAQVGTYLAPDFERIIALKPDLIIATAVGNTRDAVERLERLGVPAYVIFPKNFDDILTSIGHLGRVVDRQREAEEIVREMTRRKEKVIERTRGLPKPKVFLQIGEAPIVTVGKGSFADDLIRLAGGENIAGREKEMYPRLGMEEILKRAPEVILISSMNPMGDYQKLLREWRHWKMIPAVKNDRIHVIDSDLIDRPSPRIVEGLEEMAGYLHPGRFRK